MQSLIWFFFVLAVLIASGATAINTIPCGTSHCPNGYYCIVDKYCCKDTILPETCAKRNGINLPSSVKTQNIPTKAVTVLKTATTNTKTVATNIKPFATNIKTAANDIKSLESAPKDQVSTKPSLTSAMASDETIISDVSSTSMNVSIPTASATLSANSTGATATKVPNGASVHYTAGGVASVFLWLIGFVVYML